MNQDMNNINNTNINQVPNNVPFTPINTTNINGPQVVQSAPVTGTEQQVINPTPAVTAMPTANIQSTPEQTPMTPEVNNSALNIMSGTPQPIPDAQPQIVIPQVGELPVEQQTITPTPTAQPQPTTTNNEATNFTIPNAEQTPSTPQPVPSVTEQVSAPVEEELYKEKKKVPVLVIIAGIFVIIGIVYYIFVFPKLMNGGESTTPEQQTPANTTTENDTRTAWEKYASLRGEQVSTIKDINGGFRILADTETYYVFKDNSFNMYQSVNNLEDNYTEGTLTVSKGKEFAMTAGIDETKLADFEDGDIYTLVMTPTKEVTNGETKTDLTEEWTQIWILKDHSTEGIEAEVLNITQPTTSNYVKISD